MKKVGIITICDYENYGNRLQNYATQEILRSLGCKVETIVNTPHKIERKHNSENKFNKLKNMTFQQLVSKTMKKIKYKITKKNCIEEKKTAFKNFTKANITETQFVISKDNIPSDLGAVYDFFVVGSDQVWNPFFRKGSPIDFLTFAPKQKRIAFAPSFGISSIPEEYVEKYRLWLSQMWCLSVREQAGADIIKELTGRDATVLLDPTLMLTKEKWLAISKRASNKPRNKYLLTYFLGDLSHEREKTIKEIASQNKLEVVNLASMKDKSRYSVDPSEFIDYINSSSIFLTDSFHGCVFSILFEKPFIVFEREGKAPSMNSRIDTLLLKFKLESRSWDKVNDITNICDIDYSHIPDIMEKERKKTLNYLEEALNIS